MAKGIAEHLILTLLYPFSLEDDGDNLLIINKLQVFLVTEEAKLCPGIHCLGMLFIQNHAGKKKFSF
jgi:hypothetical protein